MSTALAQAIRIKAENIRKLLDLQGSDAADLSWNANLDIHDAETLLRVLANVVDGMPIARALGAPGDWGYETPMGRALVEYLGSHSAHGHAVIVKQIPAARK